MTETKYLEIMVLASKLFRNYRTKKVANGVTVHDGLNYWVALVAFKEGLDVGAR